MKQIIFLVLVFLLVACSPETQEVNPTRASVIRAEVTPDVVIDVDTTSVSLADVDVLEDAFTASAIYGDVSFGEAIFDAKCNACLILPDSVVSSDSDISDVYAKAIYYANGEISPEGYLVTSMQENEWTTLSENEIYHVIAYFKSAYDADSDTIEVAVLEPVEAETVTEEASEEVVEEDTSEAEDVAEETSTEDTATESDNPIVIAVTNADPSIGETLFISNFVSPCNACHFSDSDAMLVGPGLFNIRDRAGSMIEGLTAEEYIYESIIHPNDFIVEGFAAAMPTTYEMGLTENELYSLVAYLMTLGDDSSEVEVEDVAEEASEDVAEDEATEAESEEATDDTATESGNAFVLGAANADPVAGEQLFIGNFVTPCNTCHFVDTDAMLVGPGLLNIREIAASRIEGVTAEEYLYNSIAHPNDFIVDGFAPAMPALYEAGMTETDIYNLVAYLMTLGEEEAVTEETAEEVVIEEESTQEDVTEETSDDAATESDTTDDSATETESDNAFVLGAANADPVAGEQLFIGNFVTPCNTCHFVDTDAMLVGPGLLNIREIAASRIEGVTAEEYLYNSIAHPNDFIVDGFAPAMPALYEAGMTETDIYNLVAYLMTLGE